MRIELRNNSVLLDGYVNAVARDSIVLTDFNNEKFVEQIVPKTFQRALEKNDDILCLLDHVNTRVLGSTKQGNIELFEDNIGLRAICNITDEEVIEKAQKNKLRGWSFGFEILNQTEETRPDGIKRRYVDNIDLLEVSIIDDKAIPAYLGTSIEMRSGKTTNYRTLDFDVNNKILDYRDLDYSKYEQILKNL